MNKHYSFDLTQSDTELFFRPIRKQEDYVELLFRSIRFMLISHSFTTQDPSSSMYLVVDKMSRLIYKSEEKIFSVIFPFAVSERGRQLTFNSLAYGEIDSVTISKVLAALKEGKSLDSSCISSLADYVLDVTEIKPGFWSLLKEVLFLEGGYLRYDYDEAHEKERYHPLNHLDIFYSSKGSFKVGLEDRIDEEVLCDILSSESECHYLKGSDT